MTERPATVPVHASIRSVMNKLAERDVRHLPVLDEGQLVGIVSDRDLRDVVSQLVDEQPAGTALLERPIGDVMSSDVISVNPEADLDEIIDLMIGHRIGAVPVVAPGTQSLVGIVSYVDVLRAAKENEA